MVPRYLSRFDEGKLQEFWSELFKEWFERYPLGDPSTELVEKEGSLEKAIAHMRAKKVQVSGLGLTYLNMSSFSKQQVKRFFAKARTVPSGRRDLLLEDSGPRKRSEIQAYMRLFYDTRIRETVRKRWASENLGYMESRVLPDIQESEISPEDGALLKDFKIPISYKNMIAQELWEGEEEAIKAEVRSNREVHASIKTVYNTEGEERMELLREYTK